MMPKHFKIEIDDEYYYIEVESILMATVGRIVKNILDKHPESSIPYYGFHRIEAGYENDRFVVRLHHYTGKTVDISFYKEGAKTIAEILAREPEGGEA